MSLESNRDFKSNALTICFLLIVVAVTIAASSKVAPVSEGSQTVSYVENSNNPSQTLDLIMPESKVPPPLIIYVHGGAWASGDKSSTPAMGLLSHGFAVASLNYRLSGEAKFPAQLDDCRAAIRFLRQNADKFHIDANRIGLFGNSAGGHLVCLLALTGDDQETAHEGARSAISSKVQAVCDWNGVTDFKTVLTQLPCDQGQNKAVAQFLGGLPDQVPEIAKKASPLNFVTASAPPFLIIHGNSDQVVPYAQSIELNEALKKVGTDVQLITIEKGTHDLFTPETMALTAHFFEEKLKH
jgi:acetyl esterase/lipase